MRLYIIFCSIISLCRTVPLDNNENEAEDSNELKLQKLPFVVNDTVSLDENINKETNRPREPSIKLTDAQMEYYKIWPQGAIPYYIDMISYKDKVLRDRIRNFLSEVNIQTSINFMELPSPPADEETRWVFFVNRRGLLGCGDHSVVNFTTKGVQHVVLGYDCLSRRNELAEAILSIVGVPAQHNAPDRDNYIEVITENILPEKLYLFNKVNEKDWLFSNIDYDYKSASHFDTHKYSRNGKATIRIKDPRFKFVNTDCNLSAGDIDKMKMLYEDTTQKRTYSLAECQNLFISGNKKQFFLWAPSYTHIENKNINIVGSYVGHIQIG